MEILEVRLKLDEDQIDLLLGLLTEPFAEYQGRDEKLKKEIEESNYLAIKNDDWELINVPWQIVKLHKSVFEQLIMKCEHQLKIWKNEKKGT